MSHLELLKSAARPPKAHPTRLHVLTAFDTVTQQRHKHGQQHNYALPYLRRLVGGPGSSTCGIYGEQSGTGAGFLQALRFPLPILMPSTAPHSSSIIRGWYNRPISGRRAKWTQSHPTPRN
jgi:hypothetical protein